MYTNILKMVDLHAHNATCSGVEVKVLEIGNTQVKYKYVNILLKGEFHSFSTLDYVVNTH